MEGSDFYRRSAVSSRRWLRPLASRLGIGAVLGYLLAGIAIGPWGWGLLATSMRSSTFRNSAWYS